MRGQSVLTTLGAAKVGGAPGLCAFDSGSVIEGDVAVGARVERAERLAALGRFARVVDAGGALGVSDGN